MKSIPFHERAERSNRKLQNRWFATSDHAGIQRGNDLVDVVGATCPSATADLLQRRPQTRVVGQPFVRTQLRVRRSRGQLLFRSLGVERA